jgi:Bacterial Ig domain
MGLLQSGADSISPLTGSQLVAQKVAYLISAAGTFPTSGNNPSTNFAFDPNGASYVFANWPGPIVSVGTEVGGDVITGPAASADPTKNPVKYAYNLYCNNGANCPDSVPAWTQVAILYAVSGLGTIFSVGGLNGSNVVENSSGPLPGTNTWSQTPDNQQSYIEKSISAAQMESILNPYVQTTGSFTPVANSQSVETTGGPVAITLTATDGSGNTLTYSVLTQPSHGTLASTAPDLTYTPNVNFTGTDSFTFQAFDGSVGSNVATVTIQVGTAGTITKVGQAENSCTGGGCTSLSVPYSPATGSSALVFVWFDFANPVSAVSVEDSEGKNLTLDQSYSGFCAGGFSCMQVWREAHVPSGVTGYSLSWTGDDNARAIVVEYAGLGAYDPGVFHGNDNGYNGGTTWTSGISGTLSNPSDLLFCFAVDSRDATQTWTQSGSFTTIIDTNDTSTGAAHLAQWINPGTTAGEVCSGTISVTGSQEVLAIIGGYQPAAASGQPIANSQSVNSNGSPVAITLTASDSDGDSLTYTIASNPAHGTLSGTPPNVTYTPAANFSGADSFTFYVSDGNITSNIATVAITVTPIVVQANSQTVASNGAPVVITLTATDSDGDPLTYSVVSNPKHGSLSGTAPNVTYTPTSGFVGSDSFTFQAHDGQFNSNIATITINVGAAGGIITKIGQAQNFCQGGSCTSLSISYSPTAGNSVLIFVWFDFVNPTTNVSAKDSLGNPLALDEKYAGSYCAGGFSCVQVWRQTTAPSGVTDYTLNWTGGDNAGAIVVEYSGLGSYDPGVFAGHDNGYNSGPSWTTGTGGTLSNSGDLLFCFAVDGRDASQTWTQSGSFTTVLNANDSNTGALHVAQWANPGTTAGQSCSGTVGSTGNQQIVAIVGGYLPATAAGQPVANSQSLTSNGNPLVITLTASDSDGDPLTYSIVSSPSHGTLTGTPPNVTYTPSAGFNGVDTFTFVANDGHTNSNVATVTITVTQVVIQPPVANSQSVSTNGSPLPITLTATDSDGNPLTYDIVTGPTHGTLTGTPPNVTYTPATGFNGQDSFTFQAFDGSVGSNIATVTIQVVLPGIGIAKVGQASNACSGGSCTSLSVFYAPLVGDSTLVFVWFDFSHAVTGVSVKDNKGNPLTLDQTYAGTYCTTNFACLQVWRQATVPAGVTGYSINWANDDNANAVVVEYSGLGPYDSSVFHGNDNGYNSGASWTSGTGGILSNSSDLLFCFAVDGRDASQTWIQSGSFTTVLDANNSSVGAIHVANWINPGTTAGQACSGTISAVGNQQILAVIGGYQPAFVPGQPIANSQSVNSNGGPIAITLTATDSDGDTLTYSVVNLPSHGTLTGTAPNVTYTPAFNFSGSDSFTFEASDGKLNSNVATVSITVTQNVIPPPVANSQAVFSTGSPVAITLSATDATGDPLVYTILTNPSHGTLTGTPPNVTYAPVSGFTGTDSFTFDASDDTVNSNLATVTINVGTPGSITKIGQASAFCTGGGCVSLAVPYSPIAGDSVLVFLWFDFSHPISGLSVKDSQGNTLTQDQTYAGSYCTAGFACMQVWREASAPAGVSDYNINWTTDTNVGAIVVEYSGLGAYDAGVFHGTDNGYNSGPSWTTGNSGTLSSANDLLLCFAVDGRDASQTWTQGGSFSTVLNANDPSVGALHVAQWPNPDSTAAESCSGTISSTGNQEIVAIIGGYEPAK